MDICVTNVTELRATLCIKKSCKKLNRVVGYVSSLTCLNQGIPGSNVTQSSRVASVIQDPNTHEVQTSRLSSTSKRCCLMPATNEDHSSQAATISSQSSMPPPRPLSSSISVPSPSTPPSSAQANQHDISPDVTVISKSMYVVMPLFTVLGYS